MAYRVVLADAAKSDVDGLWIWILSQSPKRGPIWFERLIDALYSLEQFPERCAFAREAQEANRPIRCLLFGKRHGVYRILYEVDKRRRTVLILHIRHGARDDLSPGELTDRPEET